MSCNRVWETARWRSSELKDDIEMTVREYSNSNERDVTSFLTVAIGLAELVGLFHQAGEMSRTLSPDHLVYTPETGLTNSHRIERGI
jgi:hypothetical protein